jgi:hypothetical protein
MAWSYIRSWSGILLQTPDSAVGHSFGEHGGITANPISFTVDGQQRIAMSGDHVLYVFGL